jgi:multicomponent Na+:H+ antiporter subunit B
VIPGWAPRMMMVGGLLLYAGTGIAGIILGGTFLDYSVLAHEPTHGQHLGILLIEFGVGMTVEGAVVAIFLAFAARER